MIHWPNSSLFESKLIRYEDVCENTGCQVSEEILAEGKRLTNGVGMERQGRKRSKNILIPFPSDQRETHLQMHIPILILPKAIIKSIAVTAGICRVGQFVIVHK